MTRIERYAPHIAGVLFALPVLIARYPPMTDLPLHEALVGLLRHFGDTRMYPAGLYFRNIGEPNQLFHLTAWLLSYAMGTDTACKIVIAATMYAIPVSAARFATYLGVSRLSALLVAPIALGWLFTWGLIANLIGLAALLTALPWLDALAENPTARRAALATLGVVLLYFAHEAMMIVYGGAAILFALCHPLAPKKTALRLVPLGAAFAMAVAQAQYQRHLLTPTVASVPTWFMPLGSKLVHTPEMVFPTGDHLVQGLFFGLSVLVFALFFRARAVERRMASAARKVDGGDAVGVAGVARLRELLHRYRFEVFAGACGFAYLVFPFTLNGATLVFERFFPPAYAVLAVVAAPKDIAARAAKLPRLLAPVLPIGTLLLSWPMFADSDRAYRALDDILPLIEPNSSVAEIDFGPRIASRDFSLGPAISRALATRGGRLLYGFTDSPIAPVMMNPQYQWNEPIKRVAMNTWRFRPEHDFRRFRYLVLHTTDARLALLATLALAPEGRPIANDGEFVLFESTLPVVPLESPDVPLPNPPPKTVRKRMDELWQRAWHEKQMDSEPAPPLGADDDANDPTAIPGHL